MFTISGQILAADNKDKLDKIDKKADEIWVKSGGDSEKVREYYESLGYKYEGRSKQQNDTNEFEIMGFEDNYNIYMDFYRIDAYTVKVWTYMELVNEWGYEIRPATWDRLGLSWNPSHNNKSSEYFNYYTKYGYTKADFNVNELMRKSDSTVDTISYSIKDGIHHYNPAGNGDWIKKAYIQVTFTDPYFKIGEGPWTYYFTKYVHTYDDPTRALTLSVGLPDVIKVSWTTTPTEKFTQFSEDLGQFAP